MIDEPTKTESPALAHCGYRVEEDVPGGRFALSLETPYEGASIAAAIARQDGSERAWNFAVGVKNNRGLGWTVSGRIENAGRYFAKCLLRHVALEMRRDYMHRSKKSRERAVARAIARREAEEAGHA